MTPQDDSPEDMDVAWAKQQLAFDVDDAYNKLVAAMGGPEGLPVDFMSLIDEACRRLSSTGKEEMDD